MRKLVGRSPQGDKGRGATPAQGVPRIVGGGGHRSDSLREGSGRGAGIVSKVVAEVSCPGASKGRGGAVTNDAIVLRSVEGEESRGEVIWPEGGCLRNAEEVQE